ncbi:cytidylate kinase [Legionella adelaidensis]|uniref:Cytidylate kinase n=1 Tax=Legionella adelaidensis TaxID=45056 RepID=A0A0W0R539_9GAMM|nr:(d)CMP kinase [Legionella adelaidensis]KTC66209.1 cytidylate kinase [Legionella adelaidensis]
MNPSNHTPIITIDGPSGTGKGTLCQLLAEHLGWHFLDSGALYRVLAYAAKKDTIDFNNIPALEKRARNMNLHFEVDSKKGSSIFLDNNDITEVIRSEECGQNASKIAAIPEVRAALLERQRQFAQSPGLVTDGRDMGTVVFPRADLKLFLYATTEERANRRYLQLKEKGNDVSLAQVVEELEKRDARDTARTCSPLKPAEDAVLIDTTRLTVVQVFSNVLQLVDKCLSIKGGR